jgi:hypothetical protein
MENFWTKRVLAPRSILSLIVFCTLCNDLTAQAPAQKEDSAFIRNMYSRELSDGRCYKWLETLTQQVGHRISGSVQAEKAVQWSKSVLDTLGLDSVWLQPVMVPRWVRGEPEQVKVVHAGKLGTFPLHALALGGSVGTPKGGIQAEVVEVKTWAALDQLGEAGVRGKIVFFNRPMDPTKLHTFEAYGGAVDQRGSGASRASKYGAVAVLVRSMGLRQDDFPHTGAMHYDSAYALIPAVAISTNDAEKLSALIQSEKKVNVSVKMNCQTLPDVPSFNVIGEIRGSEKPHEIILVGGHLDSWDVGQGAHDDGAGCVQSMDVIRAIRRAGYKPRRTIRCVLFMNEENGLRGGRQYAKEAKRKNEFHLCAIETDEGGFTPRGFSFEAENPVFAGFFEKVKKYDSLLSFYDLKITKGGSGADIGPLKGMNGLLCGFTPDSQRYFDFHHTNADVFEAVNKRELELGAASISALVYLLDKYGL